jgi:hypothetical protein
MVNGGVVGKFPSFFNDLLEFKSSLFMDFFKVQIKIFVVKKKAVKGTEI